VDYFLDEGGPNIRTHPPPMQFISGLAVWLHFVNWDIGTPPCRKWARCDALVLDLESNIGPNAW